MQYGFEVGDYVIVAHPSEDTDPTFDGETFVVKSFTTSTMGQPLVRVSRPKNRNKEGSGILFYAWELELEDWQAARDPE